MRFKGLCYLVLGVMLLFSGCQKQADRGWLTLDGEAVQETEVMLYMIQTLVDFEQLGGQDVWSVEDFSGGKSAPEVAKQGAFDNLIKNRVLAMKAESMGVVLGEDDLETIRSLSSTYYGALSEAFINAFSVREEDVRDVVSISTLASLVEADTMKSFQVEDEKIQAVMEENSDYLDIYQLEAEDVLTAYRVHHIVIRTHKRQEDGRWLPLEEEAIVDAENRLEAAKEALVSGEPFTEVLAQYSDEVYLDVNPEGQIISKAQLPEAYSLAVDQLAEGEMTEVLSGDYGYHIFYLMEKKLPDPEAVTLYKTQFEQWEEGLRHKAIQKLEEEAFDLIYSHWLEVVDVVYGPDAEDFDFERIIELTRLEE